MNQDKIWDYFQNEGSESFEGSYGRLAYLLKNCKNKTVLNIGVGGGVLEKLAISYNIDIYSLDPNEKSIKKLQKLVGKNKAKVGYSQNMPFEDNFFDIVIMSEVLEHLNNNVISDTLEDVKRVLKIGGKFIGTVPYNENLNEQIVICPKCGEKFHKWGHIQSFTNERLKSLLSDMFTNTMVKQKMFITWNTLNWKGKISTSIGYCFYIMGIKKSGLNLYFEGIK